MSEVVYLKTVILGDTGVGKTALVNRFVHDKYVDIYRPTVGVEFQTKDATINGRRVIFQIWDMSGSNDFPSLVTVFCRDVDCCIFVYDVTNSETFNTLDMRIMEFLNFTHANSETFPFALIGNKTDVDKRTTSIGEALEWCSNNHFIPYFETTAKDGSLNVEEVFHTVAKTALKYSWPIHKNIKY